MSGSCVCASSRSGSGLGSYPFHLVDELQRQVAHEFGLSGRAGTTALVHADHWLGQEEATRLSLYRRHNRVLAPGRRGPRRGAAAPLYDGEVPPLETVVGGKVDLSLLGRGQRPLVLVAGSFS